MLIIGCDFHSRFQQIAMLDPQTGEVIERRLEHENGEARKFYAGLATPARVGMEATGYAQWFERMLAEQGHQLWVGDAAEIRAAVVRKQKTDSRDASHILDLLLRDKFPRIWIPSTEERDVRQLLRHRFKLVCWRTSLKNQLHAMAMGQGICRKKKLWTAVGRKELQGLSLGPWASRRRQQLLDLLDQLEPVTGGIGSSGDPRSREAPRGRALDDPARSGAGDGTGVRTDDWARRTLPEEQEASELSGPKSQ